MTTQRKMYDGFYQSQDAGEIGVYGKVTYEPYPLITVRGNDTEDKECEIAFVGGCSFKLPKDANCEILMISTGDDTTLKMALLTPPKDKQRRWKEDTGGIQHPTDPEHALEFNKTRAHLLKDQFAVGKEGIFEIKDKGTVFFRADKVVFQGKIIVNERVETPQIVNNKENIPGIQNPAEQDKTTDTA
jgi:hypothetical protein